MSNGPTKIDRKRYSHRIQDIDPAENLSVKKKRGRPPKSPLDKQANPEVDEDSII